jgi:hypothetical protein
MNLADYEEFINLIVARINRQCKIHFDEEKPYLKTSNASRKFEEIITKNY